jgi:hypothetical protein
MFLLIMLITLFFLQGAAFAQHNGIELVNVEVRNNEIEPVDSFSDILRYCPDSFGGGHSRTTQAHENVHAINSSVRNHIFSIGRKRANAFYCGKGKAIIIENPSFRLRHVSNFLPKVLRGNRYNLYLVEQLKHWDDTPTYLINEWSAYVAGAETGVEDFKNGLPKEKSDIVCGSLEFSVYCVALCMATKEYDQDYWESDKRLKHSVNYFLIRTEKVYFSGCNDFKSDSQIELLKNLRFHEDASEMRDFFIKEFNGIFLN